VSGDTVRIVSPMPGELQAFLVAMNEKPRR
jgi:hypothetical protein